MVGYDTDKDVELSGRGHGIAGILSGVMTRFLAQPLDVLKIRFQLQHEPIKSSSQNYYWSMKQACFRILSEEKYGALWKGHIPAQLLSSIYGFAQFQTFEYLTKIVHINVTSRWKPLTDFACGGLSGVVATIASMPCDTVRTRLVGQGEPKIYNGMIHAFFQMLKNEGFLALYKGLFPSLLQIVPQTGVQFASFRLFSKFYWILNGGERKTKLPITGNLICGSLAGLVAKASVYPLDLSKKRLQVQGFEKARIRFGRYEEYSGLLNCLRRTVAEEGFKGLYKGLAPSSIKAMVSTSLTFALYEEFSHIFVKLDLFTKRR